MKLTASAAAALAVLPHTLAAPASADSDSVLSQRQPKPIPELWERAIDTLAFGFEAREAIAQAEAEANGLSANGLGKRRGGGGGGRGGGSSSSGSSGSSSSGSSSSGSSSSGSRGGSSGGTGSSGSRGTTSSSSSSSPSYGGGRYYGGGSTSAYSAGSRSPSGILPFAIGGAALGFGAYALWPYNVYTYPYHTRYNYNNRTNSTNSSSTATKSRRQESGTVSLPVTCLCDPDLSCGCDDTGNTTYIDAFFGPNNQTNNATVATIQNVNGTNTVVLNGTLANGTDDSDDDSSDTSAARMLHVQAGGYTVMSAAIVASLWLL